MPKKLTDQQLEILGRFGNESTLLLLEHIAALNAELAAKDAEIAALRARAAEMEG